MYDVSMDTLYTGCNIGAYSVLTGDHYTISDKVQINCTILTITSSNLVYLRKIFDEINSSINEYEDYINDNGLPLLDYKMCKTKHMELSPIKKFQIGIKRIIRIQRSRKTNDITGILKAHKK